MKGYPTQSQIEAIARERSGPRVYFAVDPGPCSLRPIRGHRIQSSAPQVLFFDIKPKVPTND